MTAFKNILVGVDMSARSTAALDVGQHLAEIGRGEVRAAVVLAPGASEQDHRDAQEMLDELVADRAASSPPLSAEVLVGNPAHQLNQHAIEMGADVVVIGASSKDTLERVTVGSTCEALVKKSALPTLVVRTPITLPFRALAAAVDYSDISIDVLSVAHALAYDEYASLYVSHVSSTEARDAITRTARMESPQGFEERRRRAANDEFDAFLAKHDVDQLIQSGLHLTHRLTGTPWRAICEHADEMKVDIVVVGRTSKGVFKEALLGSNADKVARRAPCSVLVMHRGPGDL